MTMLNLINVSAFFALLKFFNGSSEMEDSHFVVASNVTNETVNLSYTNRRLLGRVGRFAEIPVPACEKSILVNQSPNSPMPNQIIPSYTVTVVNVCSTGCSIAEIHLDCGSFASAIWIDPRFFKRLSINDCLVNDGKPITAGGSVSFVYAQTYTYPTTVSSVKCVP